jgi:hypothetical protein
MKISDGDANYSKSCGYMVEVGVHIIYIYDIYIYVFIRFLTSHEHPMKPPGPIVWMLRSNLRAPRE